MNLTRQEECKQLVQIFSEMPKTVRQKLQIPSNNGSPIEMCAHNLSAYYFKNNNERSKDISNDSEFNKEEENNSA